MSESKISSFKKAQASFCHHCPLCSHARKKPDSLIGRMLHHRYHADRCSFWKSEKELYSAN